MVFRLRSAADNSFETLPVVIAAVLMGNIAEMNAVVLNLMSGFYLASRVLYIYTYWSGAYMVRSAVFWIGMLNLWAMFWMGATKFYKDRDV